jgi:hypothetical protein
VNTVTNSRVHIKAGHFLLHINNCRPIKTWRNKQLIQLHKNCKRTHIISLIKNKRHTGTWTLRDAPLHRSSILAQYVTDDNFQLHPKQFRQSTNEIYFKRRDGTNKHMHTAVTCDWQTPCIILALLPYKCSLLDANSPSVRSDSKKDCVNSPEERTAAVLCFCFGSPASFHCHNVEQIG